jgi:glycine/D-amino acid oxidase-like deaminating enzyme
VSNPRSLWWSDLGETTARAPLQRHDDVDVAIVGGGFTGLWTARELLRRDPALRIAVLEKSTCGFGASGRNGGWASALYPLGDDAVIARYGEDAFRHLQRELRRGVVALGGAANADAIDANYVHGGTMTFARSGMQRARLIDEIEKAHEHGSTDADVRWLSDAEARERGVVAGAIGAKYSPHCARIHPARLVRGLASTVERLGAHIYENTTVTRILGGRSGHSPRVLTPGADLHARVVIRATEAFTPTLPGERRSVVPLYSLMIATEPLPASFWDEVGFRHYETFADDRHLIIYGQRTSDNRLAFGGRGAPYHFGSTIETRFDTNPKVFALLERTLRELFPSLSGEVTHRWGGPLAMPRDLSPSVSLDSASGLAAAGGYTGDGVVLSYVAANALADLITSPGVDTNFTRLPFVQRSSGRWVYEPLRWLGINAGLAMATWADRVEERQHKESRASAWLERLFNQFPP